MPATLDIDTFGIVHCQMTGAFIVGNFTFWGELRFTRSFNSSTEMVGDNPLMDLSSSEWGEFYVKKGLDVEQLNHALWSEIPGLFMSELQKPVNCMPNPWLATIKDIPWVVNRIVDWADDSEYALILGLRFGTTPRPVLAQFAPPIAKK